PGRVRAGKAPHGGLDLPVVSRPPRAPAPGYGRSQHGARRHRGLFPRRSRRRADRVHGRRLLHAGVLRSGVGAGGGAPRAVPEPVQLYGVVLPGCLLLRSNRASSGVGGLRGRGGGSLPSRPPLLRAREGVLRERPVTQTAGREASGMRSRSPEVAVRVSNARAMLYEPTP